MPLVHFILLPAGPRYCPLDWGRNPLDRSFESCAWQALKTIIVHETLQAKVFTEPAISAAFIPYSPLEPLLGPLNKLTIEIFSAGFPGARI